MVATLYALKFLKEQGYELRYPIRALAAPTRRPTCRMWTTTSRTTRLPLSALPRMPSSRCATARRACSVPRSSAGVNGVIVEIEGGVANNAVPDRASALVRTDISKLKNAPNITLEPEGDGVRIRGWGKSGHAAMPEALSTPSVWW